MPDPLSDSLFAAADELVKSLTADAALLTLDELRIVEHHLKQLIGLRRHQVAHQMRDRGCTWAEVGRGLGISPQAAHAQFRMPGE